MQTAVLIVGARGRFGLAAIRAASLMLPGNVYDFGVAKGESSHATA